MSVAVESAIIQKESAIDQKEEEPKCQIELEKMGQHSPIGGNGDISDRIGVLVGFILINEPTNQEELEILQNLKETSQDLSGIVDADGRLPLHEKINIINRAIDYEKEDLKWLVENAFIKRVAIRQDGQEFISFTDFDCGIRLGRYKVAVEQLVKSCGGNASIYATVPDLPEFFMKAFIPILERKFVVGQKQKDGAYFLTLRRVAEKRQAFFAQLFSGQPITLN